MKKINLIPIIAVGIAAVALMAFALLTVKDKAPNGMVDIYVDGKLYAQEKLGSERDVVISQPDGKENILHISADGFHMKSSNCITQQCIAQGPVTLDNYYRRALGTEILCAHHQVRIELVLTDRTPDPDMPDI